MSDELRYPPHNLEAERGVIGSVLLDWPVMNEVADLLGPGDFYRDGHGLIWRELLDAHAAGGAFDSLLLADRLAARGEYARTAEAIEALSGVPHSANARLYAGIVAEKALARRLIDWSNETLRECYSVSLTGDQLLESAESRLFAAGHLHRREQADSRPLGDFADEAVARQRVRASGEVSGVGSGFPDLDDLTDGFHPGQLAILAARPSMGKTAFALQIAEAAAFSGMTSVLFFSLEMPGVELAERLIVGRSGVDGHRFRAGHRLRPRDADAVERAVRDAHAAAGFRVDASASRTAAQVAASARRHKARHAIGLVVVDYLQLLDAPEESRRASRQEQVTAMSRRLKLAAKEMGLPILCLSQLNRQAEGRDDHRPRMSDLRESGSLEQDADLVLLLHRPEYFDANDQPGVAELIVAKNRNGQTGTVRLVFEKHLARFRSFSPHDPPADGGPAY